MTTWEEMSYKEQLECMFWDMYKDAHGFRPRHIDTSGMTEEQLSQELTELSEIIEANETIRIQHEHQAALKMEARISDLITTGAGDRETALRWIHQAEGSDGDDDYLCYLTGLSYGYFRKEQVAA